ncbi:MFS transporter [Pontibacillus marinus]|uniref:MFS transporter n=1 Tax=Pontibacillus marinus BH030004 = DSM 16465 TaxID=1385511 RepID=A0A0A5GL36_9BACI|nr:MFS transporter [Pontibacillus marinus]KGX91875.1 hypothetical protein N783_00390 [Pontibacillus marinus BH030004 = DSM 16465]
MGRLRDNPNFKWFFTANLVSHIGTGLTMIGVPWFLVNQDGGEQLLGVITLITTILGFFISPYAGVLIDRFHRVSLHRGYDLAGFFLLTGLGIAGWYIEEYSSLLLMVIFLVSILYNMFHYPTIFAISQEIFSKKNFGKINSVMEVQGQAGTMLAGAVGTILITAFGLKTILILDGITFLIAFILFGFINYQPTVKRDKNVEQPTMVADFIEGWQFLKEKPKMLVFFLSASMPFIAVMGLNYVLPIYIANSLKAEASVYASFEMVFAGGAVLAGFTVNMLVKKLTPVLSIYMTITLFALAVLSVSQIPSVGLFLFMAVLMGWGNAGTRINMKTLQMNLIPTTLMGRVQSFIRATGVGIRVLLIAGFTLFIPTIGASMALLILSGILIFALLGVYMSKDIYESTEESHVKKAELHV